MGIGEKETDFSIDFIQTEFFSVWKGKYAFPRGYQMMCFILNCHGYKTVFWKLYTPFKIQKYIYCLEWSINWLIGLFVCLFVFRKSAIKLLVFNW